MRSVGGAARVSRSRRSMTARMVSSSGTGTGLPLRRRGKQVMRGVTSLQARSGRRRLPQSGRNVAARGFVPVRTGGAADRLAVPPHGLERASLSRRSGNTFLGEDPEHRGREGPGMDAAKDQARRVPQVPVCAIGASAGGVRALQQFFRGIRDDLGLAYVVIVHLSPEHESQLSEILAGRTRMPVRQVVDSPELEPNCVYVIPPDRELVIEDNAIRARPFSEPRGQRAPIDMFFRSIAAGRGDGMAVVLSGAGSDGALGVRKVKEARRRHLRPGAGRGRVRDDAAERDGDRGRRLRRADRPHGRAHRRGGAQQGGAAPARRRTRPTRTSAASSASCAPASATTSRPTSARPSCAASPGAWR